ncbi:Sodium-dependent phosphate transporter 1-A [Orchesella cincta]|uniref:Phosphate transporter n=1 Tax=Orchesella cincta TaxID=48709 RepID=A0A1D2MHH8_ORCCI|nr:Sodium-dependent phosphate transporter 1-A [Orchesella cincta]
MMDLAELEPRHWILFSGFIVSFVLAFGIGANDVANSFGTSVGSRVLTLRTACLLATIFEVSGAVLLGYKVSDTIRKGIIDVTQYQDNPVEYMIGNLSALAGSAIWLIMATFLKMPISGTHSIVGAVLGFSIVARGLDGINWLTLGKIVGSWFVSPVLSGLVSSSIFVLIRKFILSKQNPVEPGLRSLPIFYGITLFINVVSILLDGPDMLKIQVEGLPAWSEQAFGLLISIGIGLFVAFGVQLIVVPKLKRELTEGGRASLKNPDGMFTVGASPGSSHDASPVSLSLDDVRIKSSEPPPLQITGCSTDDVDININVKTTYYGVVNEQIADTDGKKEDQPLEVVPMVITPNSSAAPLIMVKTSGVSDNSEHPSVGRLFSFLQILTAAFGSFAHGGNDVSNAIGPLIALYLVFDQGSVQQKAATPLWLLVYGGVGISLGLWIWGRRVIKTMGEDLTKITPSSGFTIEIGAAITVLIASKIGLPISTTHCKVGSVVAVGQMKDKNGVDWKLFRNIIFAWLVTVPVSGGLTALLMWLLTMLIMGAPTNDASGSILFVANNSTL